MRRDTIVAFTRREAETLGLFGCANCGYPPNNHFHKRNKPWKCAHKRDSYYKEQIRVGKIIK